MSSEEVKTENSSQDGKTEAKTYSDEQFKGLLADKQAEVKKRQEAEKQIADLQSKVETLSSRTSRANEDNGGSSFAEAMEDKPLTIGQFQKLMAEQNRTSEENSFRLRQAESEQAAMGELTAEKCGDGLDYASVVAAGEANLTEGDKLAIKQAKDPAAEKYRRCVMLSPELSAKAETVRTNRLLENIKLTGKVPASGGIERGVTEADVSKMSEAELDKLAESIV